MGWHDERPMAEFAVDTVKVAVYPNRAQAGMAAARAVQSALAARQAAAGCANVIFAAAPSQNDLLAALVAEASIDWSRVNAFHMDEYLGIAPGHPASFRHYLASHLFERVCPQQVHWIRADSGGTRPLAVCLAYETLLLDQPPDIVCAGVGENGHLAFNDPGVADFADPVLVKVVKLDAPCREQQVQDGCFGVLSEVPTHAITLTIPALLRASTLIATVPGARKAGAVAAMLRGEISENCPASVLRRHADTSLYLDRESARLVL